MVERQPSKLYMPVRSRSLAPINFSHYLFVIGLCEAFIFSAQPLLISNGRVMCGSK